jgi:hypothetical protein
MFFVMFSGTLYDDTVTSLRQIPIYINSSPTIVLVITSRSIRWEGHVAIVWWGEVFCRRVYRVPQSPEFKPGRLVGVKMSDMQMTLIYLNEVINILRKKINIPMT